MAQAASAPKAYFQGHDAAVLRSHASRTAQTSAAYLIPHLKPGFKILDCGCGPGTISVSLAELVPEGSVVGIEPAGVSSTVLENARKLAAEKDVDNVKFEIADIHNLQASFEAGSFDVVHAHQVLQHISDPVKALKEMRRVLKPDGILAVREGDFDGMTMYPDLPALHRWRQLHHEVAEASGGQPNAGRRLHAWARKAGFEPSKMIKSASLQSFMDYEGVKWWGQMWEERMRGTEFRKRALEGGKATEAELDEIAEGWKQWHESEDAWFTYTHGELLARV
ncbi:UbiE/COQ5 family methyltransferase [Leucosporidium creatinivorum]|uniref:UbiE/COQ5 family methyltransferase n=1 Tax=Leucosporidium creatinivorum TaxID=106004 RepID=A0A1Y2FG11_9BASI|nr:UbiE/COQ5 family methyltransferase [Leucosporidium creatinivorum]